MCKVVVLPIQPIAFWCSCGHCHCGILKSLLFLYCDALLMNQGHNLEISRGMHNFPSLPSPQPYPITTFSCFIHQACCLPACRCLLYFFYKYVAISACKKGSGRHLHAGELPLSAFSRLFSKHTGLPMITCRFSGNQHLGMKKKKAVVLRKKLFQRNKQA